MKIPVLSSSNVFYCLMAMIQGQIKTISLNSLEKLKIPSLDLLFVGSYTEERKSLTEENIAIKPPSNQLKNVYE